MPKISGERLQLILTALCGIFLLVSFLALIPGVNLGKSDHWAIAAALAGAYFAAKSAWASLSEKSLDVNLLMVVAAIGAVVVGHIDDAAVLLFLFSLSSTMESLAMARTQSAIEALVKLRPEKAIKITPEGDVSVPVEELQIGDHVRVLSYEPIPTDGALVTERASLNESSMTGESRSIEKVTGDQLLGGTQNLDSMLVLSVTKTVEDSTLSKIVNLVQEAQDNKASGERISKWFGERYTIFVVVAFLLSLGLRMAFKTPFNDAFYSSLILLVALSPCALVISSPAAALSALAYAARNGILVRGGQYIEEAGRVTSVALDKTGTLTAGTPMVVEICVSRAGKLATVGAAAECDSCGPNCDCIICWHDHENLNEDARETLRLAASAEAFSTHPIAEAIVAFANKSGLAIPESSSLQVHAGLGVEAVVEGRTIRIGQVKFFESQKSEVPESFVEHVDEMRTRGLTAVLLHTGENWAAIGLSDRVRNESKSLISNLRKLGVSRIAMLTGDNVATANAIASEVGITDVHAALMPDDKLKLIENWVDSGERVLMVGDGVNDAPALSKAHLGIAMGGLGSEVALRAADVVLVSDRISRIPQLIGLGKLTNRVIRANLIFAAGVICCLTIASFVTKLPLPVAVIGHEGSTVLVILNGLRLLRGPRNISMD